MRHALLRFAAPCLSVLLCSCGFMTPAQQYAGEPRPASDVAVILSYHGSPLGDEYHATISGYAYRPTFDIVVQAGFTYTLKCEAAGGKATVSVSQATPMR